MDPKRLIIILLALSCVGFIYPMKQPKPLFGHARIAVADGVILAANPPAQTEARYSQTVSLHDAQLTPLANFEFDARLISVKWYRDRESRYSPVDLGLGWGRMSDSVVIDAVQATHLPTTSDLAQRLTLLSLTLALTNHAAHQTLHKRNR
jgi:hypothetical protein